MAATCFKYTRKVIPKHLKIPGTDVQFIEEILNVCDVIETEQLSTKAKITSLQAHVGSVGIPRPGKCRMPGIAFSKWNLKCISMA